MAFTPQTFTVDQLLTAAIMNQMDENIDEVRRFHLGSSPPPSLVQGVFWLDNTVATQVGLKVYDGSSWITVGTVDATNNVFQPDNTQAAFFAYANSAQSNVTGDQTKYQMQFDAERFDVGSDYNTTTDTFTAPVDGYYLLIAEIMVFGVSSHDLALVYFDTSNEVYIRRTEIASSNGEDCFVAIALVDMDANDTVTVSLTITGGAKVVDVHSFSGGDVYTNFQGLLYRRY